MAGRGIIVSTLAITLVCLFLFMAAAPAVAIEPGNIAVSSVEATQAVLVVKTDLISDATIDYGSSPGSYTGSKNSNAGTRHEITLDGLSPGSVVYYRVTVAETGNPANAATLPEASFRTQRPAGEAFSYAAGGDNHPNSNTTVQPAVWNTIVGQMAAENLDLSLSVGDIIMGVGSDSVAQSVARYDGFFDVLRQLTVSAPLYVAVGNHEIINYADSRAAYEQEFTLPLNNGADAGTYGEEYYSFDNGDTHFIALCTEIPGQEGLITGNQKDWLEADLAATDKVWKVVFMHRPLFSGQHILDRWVNPLDAIGQQNKEDIHALFQSYGVDAVFEGHEHHYLHHQEDGIQYIITGGGGASLSAPLMLDAGDIFGVSSYEHVKVDETTSSMSITALDSSGAVLENFKLWALDLGLSSPGAYWGSYRDYRARDLTVIYQLVNNDNVDLSNIQVTDITANNGVSALTATPMVLADLAVGESEAVTVNYHVPVGVSAFSTSAGVTCDDEYGNSYTFPD